MAVADEKKKKNMCVVIKVVQLYLLKMPMKAAAFTMKPTYYRADDNGSVDFHTAPLYSPSVRSRVDRSRGHFGWPVRTVLELQLVRQGHAFRPHRRRLLE
eukprot:4428710-Prymnesium_polylepis.1